MRAFAMALALMLASPLVGACTNVTTIGGGDVVVGAETETSGGVDGGCASTAECGPDEACEASTGECVAVTRCDDGVQNGNETGVDCGGSCPRCGLGEPCKLTLDCILGASCIQSVCQGQDECADGVDNCAEDATCTNTDAGFSCTCKAGYTGDGVTCTDADECTLGTDDCADVGLCENTVGGFTCTCADGYTGDGVTCTDEDECTLGTAGCSADATCANTDGGFTCTCNAPLVGDGFTCGAAAECTGDPGVCGANASCTDQGDGTSLCICNAGYGGNGLDCADEDECDQGTDSCASIALCTNTDGGFTCTCPSGYGDTNGDGTVCDDVDECVVGTAMCDANATCTNTTGSFSCACNQGYTGNGMICAPLLLGDPADPADPVKWGDGSSASSCVEYLFPPAPFPPAPPIDGAYSIEDGAGGTITVFCDMTTDNGGWTCMDAATAESGLTVEFTNYLGGCSVAEWFSGALRFGEIGACNDATGVRATFTLPFPYSEFFMEGFESTEAPGGGTWELEAAGGAGDFSGIAWGTTWSSGWGDMTFGSLDNATPTTSYAQFNPTRQQCDGCTWVFGGNGQLFSLGLASTSFSVEGIQGGGDVGESVLIWTAGSICWR